MILKDNDVQAVRIEMKSTIVDYFLILEIDVWDLINFVIGKWVLIWQRDITLEVVYLENVHLIVKILRSITQDLKTAQNMITMETLLDQDNTLSTQLQKQLVETC